MKEHFQPLAGNEILKEFLLKLTRMGIAVSLHVYLIKMKIAIEQNGIERPIQCPKDPEKSITQARRNAIPLNTTSQKIKSQIFKKS